MAPGRHNVQRDEDGIFAEHKGQLKAGGGTVVRGSLQPATVHLNNRAADRLPYSPVRNLFLDFTLSPSERVSNIRRAFDSCRGFETVHSETIDGACG
jgi:hypothetical protein